MFRGVINSAKNAAQQPLGQSIWPARPLLCRHARPGARSSSISLFEVE